MPSKSFLGPLPLILKRLKWQLPLERQEMMEKVHKSERVACISSARPVPCSLSSLKTQPSLPMDALQATHWIAQWFWPLFSDVALILPFSPVSFPQESMPPTPEMSLTQVKHFTAAVSSASLTQAAGTSPLSLGCGGKSSRLALDKAGFESWFCHLVAKYSLLQASTFLWANKGWPRTFLSFV